MKIVYSYNPVTKEYAGEDMAALSPLEPGVYIYPANSTAVKPPDFGDGETVVFNGENWEKIIDLRGETQINTQTLELSAINYLGGIKDGFYLLNDQEMEMLENGAAAVFENGVLTVKERELTVYEKIENLERKQTARMLRGAALGNKDDITRLEEIELKIKKLREEIGVMPYV